MGLRGPKPKRQEIKWTEDFAYAVGLLATDGCLSSDGRHLSLVSKDREQVEAIKRCLGLGAGIRRHDAGVAGKDRAYFRIQWGDVILYDFLRSIGIRERKSLTIGALQIPDEYFFDFLRGSFDGDGSFYSYRDPRWSTSFMIYTSFASASHAHVCWLRETVRRLAGIVGHVSVSKRGNGMYSLRYAKRESLQLLARLYSKAGSACLARKRLKIERSLRIVGELLPAGS